MTSTSSVHPPILDTTLPGTPAKEWANNTTSALLPGSQSTATTPGSELPGAYPNAQEALAPITNSGPGVGETLVETARTYLPQGVLNTMDNYLGESVFVNQHSTLAESSRYQHYRSCQGVRERHSSPTLPSIAGDFRCQFRRKDIWRRSTSWHQFRIWRCKT